MSGLPKIGEYKTLRVYINSNTCLAQTPACTPYKVIITAAIIIAIYLYHSNSQGLYRPVSIKERDSYSIHGHN